MKVFFKKVRGVREYDCKALYILECNTPMLCGCSSTVLRKLWTISSPHFYSEGDDLKMKLSCTPFHRFPPQPLKDFFDRTVQGQSFFCEDSRPAVHSVLYTCRSCVMVILSSLSHLAFLLCFVLSVSHVCAVTKPEWDGNSKLIYSYSCFVYNLNCLCRRLLTLHWLFEMFFDNICYYALLFYPPPPHPPLQLMVSVQKWAPFIYYNFVDDLLNVIFSPI